MSGNDFTHFEWHASAVPHHSLSCCSSSNTCCVVVVAAAAVAAAVTADAVSVVSCNSCPVTIGCCNSEDGTANINFEF